MPGTPQVGTAWASDTALDYTDHLSISGSGVYLSQGDGGVQHITLP